MKEQFFEGHQVTKNDESWDDLDDNSYDNEANRHFIDALLQIRKISPEFQELLLMYIIWVDKRNVFLIWSSGTHSLQSLLTALFVFSLSHIAAMLHLMLFAVTIFVLTTLLVLPTV